ncbi:PREDICTED: LOW QUALITY PROTEIN uncharacterized LOC103337057 [Prunus dulcis]|uniref:PREDICTED: LOW QUALITY PROTEIN uncharacterized LOC103337057 n=1 Tax=Prunus dulcis TaxID=3755 RepID=A0A5E4FY18_PRUDU|nr:PREDICTED: LOW QUALITY PROTEIN uncharacterized LOC103337057 [Prunus dulcis]
MSWVRQQLGFITRKSILEGRRVVGLYVREEGVRMWVEEGDDFLVEGRRSRLLGRMDMKEEAVNSPSMVESEINCQKSWGLRFHGFLSSRLNCMSSSMRPSKDEVLYEKDLRRSFINEA